MPDRAETCPSEPEFVATIPGLVHAATTRFADADCIVTPDCRLSYGQLDAHSRALAARLVSLGVGKGGRVGILFPNGVAWVVAWAAAARIGAVVIPINTFYTAPELGRFLRHADVQVIVGVDHFLHHDYLARLELIAPELAHVPPRADGPLFAPSLPQLRRVLLWGESSRPWAVGDLGVGLDAALSGPPTEVLTGLEEDVTPGDTAVVIYTSGSTGDPKGVVLSHGALVRHSHNLARMSALEEGTRTWTPMPLFWVGGLVFTLLRLLHVGGTLITQEVFEPGAALRLISRERATTVGAWPGASKALIDHPDFATTDLSSVTRGTLHEILPDGSHPSDPTLAIGALGMTETCGPHTFYTIAEEAVGAPEEYRGTFGHEVPGVAHRIVNPETGRDVAEGEEGEVLVRGYSLMLGMYKRERADVFDADGWYHTDDRGLFRDGWFFFTGRQSDMIKTGGSNVAPAEVEACLVGMADVKLAFVVGVPHLERGEDVVALVVPWASTEVDPAELRRRVKEQLSSYKVPRHTFVIGDADVPWLPSMKADRRALAALAARLVAGPVRSADGQPATG